MDKNQPSPFYDQKDTEIVQRFLELFIDHLDQDSASHKRLVAQAVQMQSELRKVEVENEEKAIYDFLGSIIGKWLNDEILKDYLDKDMAEIMEAEVYQDLEKFYILLGKLNVAADLIEEQAWIRENSVRLTEFCFAHYAIGITDTPPLFLLTANSASIRKCSGQSSISGFGKREMPDSNKAIFKIASSQLMGFAHHLISGVEELRSDEEIEKYYELLKVRITDAATYCYARGIFTGSIVLLQEDYSLSKKYERKIRELKKAFNRYPGIFGSKQKWERKVFVIVQELAETSNHLPDQDRPGDKNDFWACLYKINEYSESILSNWSQYLNDPSTVGLFQSMDQTRRYMEKTANYSDKLEMAIDKLENSIKSQDQ